MLVEADLSGTSIKEIPSFAFNAFRSLQTGSLPNSFERICGSAFCGCTGLVTATVLLDSKSIEIEPQSFRYCSALANLALPHGSYAETPNAGTLSEWLDTETINAFEGCALLQDRFGEKVDSIVTGLVARLDGFPVHRLCYHHASSAAQELCRCIETTTKDDESPAVDDSGRTPFHVLFSTSEPSHLLEVLLDKYPYHTGNMHCKDANGKRPLDYLVSKLD